MSQFGTVLFSILKAWDPNPASMPQTSSFRHTLLPHALDFSPSSIHGLLPLLHVLISKCPPHHFNLTKFSPSHIFHKAFSDHFRQQWPFLSKALGTLAPASRCLSHTALQHHYLWSCLIKPTRLLTLWAQEPYHFFLESNEQMYKWMNGWVDGWK